MTYNIALFFLVTVCFTKITDGLQCIDEEGNAVDWYVVYKLPKLYDNEMIFEDGPPTGARDKKVRDNLANGVSYMYLDAKNQSFYLTSKTVNDSSSSFYRTLAPIYNKTNSIGYGFYNDELPNEYYSYDHGHTKGAFGFDSEKGFWLIQNVPKFPNFVNNGYSYPQSGTVYGQSMLCVTLTVDQFDIVGKHFQYTYPQFYNVTIPADLRQNLPNLIASALNNDHIEEPPFINTFNIVSKGWFSRDISLKKTPEKLTLSGGVNFQIFSKYAKAELDIVSDYMSDQLESDLYSETWQHGSKNLPSKCKGSYWTWNVEYLDFSFNPRINFENYKDHSKWAISAPTSQPSDWVCIGDMNRQSSQADRCGGYACWQNSDVMKQFQSAVTEIEKC